MANGGSYATPVTAPLNRDRDSRFLCQQRCDERGVFGRGWDLVVHDTAMELWLLPISWVTASRQSLRSRVLPRRPLWLAGIE